jgi:membrane protease YdiL (CAAX protease family)
MMGFIPIHFYFGDEKMTIANILFNKQKDTGFRIGFIALFLIAIALIYPTFTNLGGLSDSVYAYQSLLIAGLIMTIFFSTLLRNKTKTTFSKGLNPTTVSKQVGVIIIGVTAGILLVIINSLTGQATNILLNSSLGEIPYDALYLGILAGVSEELFFRGFIQNMIKFYVPSMILAVVPTAFIFALFHYFAYADTSIFIVLFVVGIVLGLLHEIYNDIGVPMLAHIVNNIFSMLPLVIATITGNILIIGLVGAIIIFAYLIAVRRSH